VTLNTPIVNCVTRQTRFRAVASYSAGPTVLGFSGSAKPTEIATPTRRSIFYRQFSTAPEATLPAWHALQPTTHANPPAASAAGSGAESEPESGLRGLAAIAQVDQAIARMRFGEADGPETVGRSRSSTSTATDPHAWLDAIRAAQRRNALASAIGSKLRLQRCVLALERHDLPPRVGQVARQASERGPEPLRTLGSPERLCRALYQRVSTAV
jgi:hypothetical protein